MSVLFRPLLLIGLLKDFDMREETLRRLRELNLKLAAEIFNADLFVPTSLA